MSAAKRPRTLSPAGESIEAQPIHDNPAAVPPMESAEAYYFAEGMDPDGSRFTLLSKPSRFTGQLIPGSTGKDLDLKKTVTFVELCNYETGFKRSIDSAVNRQYSFHNNTGDTISTLHYSQISFEDPTQTTTDPGTHRMLTALESITELHRAQADALRSLIELQRGQADALRSTLEIQKKQFELISTLSNRMDEMSKQTSKLLKIVKRNRYL